MPGRLLRSLGSGHGYILGGTILAIHKYLTCLLQVIGRGTTITPELQAPGAGLPKIEWLMARLRFGWARRRTTREQFGALFESERDKILELARSCDEKTGCRPVLIDRFRGMEDSSRYWSVFMTLDHLRIVNLAAAGVIRALGKGQVPDRKASTADVKPDPDANVTSI